jgi:hypothetical protein
MDPPSDPPQTLLVPTYNLPLCALTAARPSCPFPASRPRLLDARRARRTRAPGPRRHVRVREGRATDRSPAGARCPAARWGLQDWSIAVPHTAVPRMAEWGTLDLEPGARLAVDNTRPTALDAAPRSEAHRRRSPPLQARCSDEEGTEAGNPARQMGEPGGRWYC